MGSVIVPIDPSSTPIFQLQGVYHCFGEFTALADVSLTIAAGERVALIGPSGAGKSTLLSLLNGSLRATAGKVAILGHALADLPPKQRRRIQRHLGTVYQQHHLVMNLAVIHNVNAGQLGRWSLGKAAVSLVWPQGVATAARALGQVGLADHLYGRTDRLSGGQQQRVALARVLVQDPLVILADEPVSSLDPARSQDIMELLCQLTLSQGKTLVVSLHDVDLALRYGTRIVGLRQGQLLFDAPPDQVTPALIQRLYALSPDA
ncbi:phosphonate ABC transporter ATP-binding protein [Prochlorothrix hollandica]|uniref:ABC transporter ATP-binding protein n=1 Tax=Prochlorothrix hollandica PCC 9006 = CALU 1027 TaxID=317619 RepID=A0A0M2PNI8_PROHO|nr:ATP-binding cassette domain-containing protein [Prochlorothrix hollandica]KKI98180.1 ABC transporter ATP-binding protein [Prochlorothrix hollandica PCC 9006 = CALU 1027]